MICPGSNMECDNPGCRRGGCQGRLPELPLFRLPRTAALADPPRHEPHRPALTEDTQPIAV